MRETWIWSLGWEDPLEKGKGTHSIILAWGIPWTVWSIGWQRVGHDWATLTSLHSALGIYKKSALRFVHSSTSVPKAVYRPLSEASSSSSNSLQCGGLGRDHSWDRTEKLIPCCVTLGKSQPLWAYLKVKVKSLSRVDSLRLLCPWDSPGKNTGVGCHFLLQGIFLTQGSNLGLPHCRQML